MSNHHIDKDVLFFINLYDDYIENNILYYLGLFSSFNISVLYSSNELLISFYKDKNTLFTQELDISPKSSIFSRTDLSIEISCDIILNVAYSCLNLTNYYILFDNEIQSLEDIDDGIIISNSKYNLDFSSYLLFKASILSNISREIINSKNRLENFDELIEKQNAEIILNYYYVNNLYRNISLDLLIKEKNIKTYATEGAINLARKIINGI